MARCLAPITIPNLSKNGSPSACPVGFWKDNLRPYFNDAVVVPCGKCINCLKNKQSSMVVRIKREAEKRGSLVFVTLTYDDEHLPLSQSLWSVSHDTGEYTLEAPAEIISSARFPDPVRLGQMQEILPGRKPRFIDVPIPGFSLADPSKDFFARITPSVCREDVRLWLKRARVAYERAFDKKLDIAYCLVPEYGPRTCRPHYHLCIMGASIYTVQWMCKLWTYGFYKADNVDPLKDSSDGFSKVAFYIGKYMSKGKFECESVLDGSAEKPRVCQSLKLGTGDYSVLLPYVACYDLYGKYDLNTLCFESGKKLDDSQLFVLCNEIPKRLVYRLSDKITLPLPRVLRNKIFYAVDKYEKPVKTAIWYLVTSAIRDKYADMGQREFIEFCSSHPERTAAENCAAFEASRSFAASLQAAAGETRLQEYYSRVNSPF